MILNIVLILAVALVFVYLVYKSIQKKKNAEVEKLVENKINISFDEYKLPHENININQDNRLH